jgi:hypothetical protein
MSVEVNFGCEDHKPPVFREATVQCVAYMTDEEREEYFQTQPADIQMEHEERKKNGYYKRCPKTDWCRLWRENKEREENEKAERLATLEAREAVLVEHAKIEEKKLKDADERSKSCEEKIKKLEANMEKLANLLSQLI